MKTIEDRRSGQTAVEWFVILLLGIVLLIPVGVFINRCILGNKQIVDFKQNFNAAYVKGDSNIWTRVEIKAWKDYGESDSIQIVMPDGKAVYTHLSNVKLVQE